ncbi:unnamed protein product [Symbiodinium natans]|uniref:Uncharacterized protein n=1 Tax=Symbiodinium natans TaxID=878477 RepID=A0A812T7U0_9DINO|nr:unnamed protein product [Symbiodinium natans]
MGHGAGGGGEGLALVQGSFSHSQLSLPTSLDELARFFTGTQAVKAQLLAGDAAAALRAAKEELGFGVLVVLFQKQPVACESKAADACRRVLWPESCAIGRQRPRRSSEDREMQGRCSGRC